MKRALKILSSIFVIILLCFVGYSWMNYAADKSVEELKEKWAYDNSQFLEMDGMSVHYRINGEGEPLVLIHGTGASVHTWEEWTKNLEKDYKVISMDIPAFGLTGPNPQREYTLDYYAKFVDQFLGKIGIESCSMAGNSLGGGIAWKYATLFPNKVKSLVLIDAIGYPMDKEPPLAFKLAQNKLTSKFLLSVTPKSLFYKSMKEVYHNDDLVTDKVVDRYYDLYLREGNRQAFVDRVNDEELVDHKEIASIKTPTLIMWGAQDEWVPVKNAHKFAKDIEDAELIIYENAGHIPMEEIPEQSAMDTRKFKEKHLVPALVTSTDEMILDQ